MAGATGGTGQLTSGAVETSTAFTADLYDIHADNCDLSLSLISPSNISIRQSDVVSSISSKILCRCF